MQTDAELLDLINKTVSSSPGEVNEDKDNLPDGQSDTHDVKITTTAKDYTSAIKDAHAKPKQAVSQNSQNLSVTESHCEDGNNISATVDTTVHADKINNVKEECLVEGAGDKVDSSSAVEGMTRAELIEELLKTRKTLDETRRSLAKAERVVEKSDNYNGVLRKMVEQLSSELHRYKNYKTETREVQVDKEDLLNYTIGESIMPTWEPKVAGVAMETEVHEVSASVNQPDQDVEIVEPVSIADSIKAAAEAVVQQQTQEALVHSGYVFDQQSGLYYHSESGYYYSSEKGLYYDPSSGTYFYYNYDTGEYQFHSKIDPAEYYGSLTQVSSQNDKSGVHKPGSVKKKKKKKSRAEEGKVFRNRKERRKAELERKARKKRKKSKRRHSHRKRSKYDKGSSDEESEWDSELETVIHRSERRHRRKRRKHETDGKYAHDNGEVIVLSDASDNGKRKDKSLDKVQSDKTNSNDEQDVDGDEKKQEKIENSKLGENENCIDDKVNSDEVQDRVEEHLHNTVEKSRTKKSRSGSKENGEKSKEGKSENKPRDDRYSTCDSDDDSNKMEVLSEHDSASCIVLSSGCEIESGELSDSTYSSCSTSEDSSSDSSSGDSSESDMDQEELGKEDVAGSWPPCIRAIVTESDCVNVGMLYLVTCAGATVGREGEGNHDIPLPDINVSKVHAEIQFNTSLQCYEILDKGSQNGTLVNDERLSQPKETSTARPITHGDVVQIGVTKLLCHIHTGSDTCDDCEPGIAMAKHRATLPPNEVKILTAEDKKKIHRDSIKELKKKYGLKNADYEENKGLYNNRSYANRAEERRQTVGSDVPGVKRTSDPASVHKPISSENVGRKLLQKMGWKEGESLGKDNSGIQEPIAVTLRVNQAAGLGSATAGAFSADDANTVDVRKAGRRVQAQQRYNQIKGDTTGSSSSNPAKDGNRKWTQGETEYT